MNDYPKPIILRDSREKPGHGYKFIKCGTCSGTEIIKLDFGDYAIKDHLDLIVVERKQSITELCNNIGRYRDRFEAELQRMVDMKVKRRYMVVEDYWTHVFKQKYTKMHPNAIFESIISLSIQYGLQTIMAGTSEMGHRITRSLLLKAWKYHCEGKL
jgi:ERCC4-type nuclease